MAHRGGNSRVAVLLTASLLAGAPASAAPAEIDVSSQAVEQAIQKIEGFDFPIEIRKLGTEAETRLGRDLFFDPRLSRDGTLSCSSCHQPDKTFTDGRARAHGRGGRELRRNAPTLLGVTIAAPYIRGLFLDGRATTIEEAALTVIQEPTEFNNSLPALVATLGGDRDYARRFREVYGPDGLTADDVAKALATYIRSLAPSRPSPYDRALADPSALSLSQKRGLLLFTGKAGCLSCHWNPDITSGEFVNTGLAPLPGIKDAGRYEVTHSSDDWRAFKVPSLRDVALTAPYMHDGSLKTLADVIEFYNRGGDRQPGQDSRIRPLHLSSREKSDLEAFLRSLSNEPAAPQEPVADSAAPEPASSRYWDVRLRVEANIDRAGALLDDLEAASKPWTAQADYSGARCLERASPETLARDAAAYRFNDRETKFLDRAAFDDVTDYYKFRAFTEKNPSLCDELDRQKVGYSPYGGKYQCRNWYVEATLLRAMLGPKADFPRACRDAAAMDESARANADALCSVIGSHLDDPPAMCAELRPRFIAPNWIRTCEYVFRPLKGVPVDCAPYERSKTGQDRCLMIDAFSRASRAQDPRLCGGNEACEVLMGDGAAVAARISARVKAEVCRATSPAEPAKAAGALLDQAQGWLKDSGADLASTEAVESERRIASLQERLRKSSSEP